MPELKLTSVPVAYEERGSGPTLVLVHGLAVNGQLWREVVPLLEDRFRVIVLDLPLGAHRKPVPAGTDLTPPALARAISEALDELDLHDVTLVGNDTGGGLSQLVAAHHPERLGRLVLTNCDAYDQFPPTILKPLGVLARRSPAATGALLRGLRFGWGRTLFALPVNAHRDPALLREWLAPLASDPGLRRDVTTAMAGLQPRHHEQALPGLKAFAKPVLLAWAPGDPLFPMRLAERLETDLADARIVRLGRGRAFTPLDQPESLAQAIAGFAGARAAPRPAAVEAS